MKLTVTERDKQVAELVAHHPCSFSPLILAAYRIEILLGRPVDPGDLTSDPSEEGAPSPTPPPASDPHEP
jgi:hypothetical protein